MFQARAAIRSTRTIVTPAPAAMTPGAFLATCVLHADDVGPVGPGIRTGRVAGPGSSGRRIDGSDVTPSSVVENPSIASSEPAAGDASACDQDPVSGISMCGSR